MASFLLKNKYTISNERLKQLSFTFITQLVVLIMSFITIQLSAKYLGVDGFGEYNVARKVISTLTFPLLLGLGIAIPKYIASASGDFYRSFYLIFSALVILFFTLAVFIMISYFNIAFFSLTFWGNIKYQYLVKPTIWAVVGLSSHTLLSAYFRGLLKLNIVNTLQIVNIGVLPLTALFWCKSSTSKLLEFLGISWCLTSIPLLLIITISGLFNIKFSKKEFYQTAKQVLVFGIIRLPGEFALFAYFSLPIFFITQFYGVRQAGFFSLGLSFFQLCASFFEFSGVFLLPHISKLYEQKEYLKIKKNVGIALILTSISCLVLVVFIEVIMEYLIKHYFGKEFIASISSNRILLLGALPYTVYMVLRNPLDAISFFPYNSINLVTALLIQIVILWCSVYLFPDLYYLSIVFSSFCLAIITFISWSKEIKKNV